MSTYGSDNTTKVVYDRDNRRASPSPGPIRPCPIDWSDIEKDHEGKRCIRYGTIVTKIDNSKGMYGPFKRSATDGRQKLSRSESFIVNETVCEEDVSGGAVKGFETGDVYMANILLNEGEAPTTEEFNEAFKQVRPISD